MTFSPSWRTSTAVSLAEQIRGGEWHLCQILADALEDAGADGAALAPLRDTGIADSRSGLWLAGVLGKGGLWEWGQLVERERLILEQPCQCGCRCSERGLTVEDCECRGSEWAPLNCRREELQLAHTQGLGERWDECRCPACHQFRIAPGTTPCEICGGSGDLLRCEQIRNNGGRFLSLRPISYDLGPLPVVTVRLEEMAREEPCPAKCRGGRYDPPCSTCAGLGRVPDPDSEYIDGTMDCPDCESENCVTCSGSGVVQVPSAWLRALPPEYDLTLEGAEPYHNGSGHVWYDLGRDRPNTDVPIAAELPTWLFDWVDSPSIVSNPRWKVFSSPAAATAALIAALRRWRFA